MIRIINLFVSSVMLVSLICFDNKLLKLLSQMWIAFFFWAGVFLRVLTSCLLRVIETKHGKLGILKNHCLFIVSF